MSNLSQSDALVVYRLYVLSTSSSNYTKIRFRPGLRPEPRWRSLRRFPRTPVSYRINRHSRRDNI